MGRRKDVLLKVYHHVFKQDNTAIGDISESSHTNTKVQLCSHNKEHKWHHMKSQPKSLSHWVTGMGFECVGIQQATHVICQRIMVNSCFITTKLLQLNDNAL